jgi:hypothetical protein
MKYWAREQSSERIALTGTIVEDHCIACKSMVVNILHNWAEIIP